MRHKLHNHPWEEEWLGLVDEVIVDDEFKNLFTEYRDLRNGHVIVDANEYYKKLEELYGRF